MLSCPWRELGEWCSHGVPGPSRHRLRLRLAPLLGVRVYCIATSSRRRVRHRLAPLLGVRVYCIASATAIALSSATCENRTPSQELCGIAARRVKGPYMP